MVSLIEASKIHLKWTEFTASGNRNWKPTGTTAWIDLNVNIFASWCYTRCSTDRCCLWEQWRRVDSLAALRRLSDDCEESFTLLRCHAWRLQYVTSFVLLAPSHPLRASVGVSPLIKLFAQVAHSAVTRSNSSVGACHLGVGQHITIVTSALCRARAPS